MSVQRWAMTEEYPGEVDMLPSDNGLYVCVDDYEELEREYRKQSEYVTQLEDMLIEAGYDLSKQRHFELEDL